MKRIPVFVGEDPVTGLQEIVDVLNDGKKADPRLTARSHQKLLRLVRAWKKSGPDLLKMDVSREDDVSLDDIKGAYEWVLAPASDGRAYVSLSPTGKNFRDIVAVHFGRLILSPNCEKLGGPCPKCERYYVKQTLRPSAFCSRKCAGGAMQAR